MRNLRQRFRENTSCSRRAGTDGVLYPFSSGKAVAVIEFVDDTHLRIAIYDAMRGVKLSTLKRTLTEDERNEISAVMFSRYKRCGWRVVCYLNGRSASAMFMPSTGGE